MSESHKLDRRERYIENVHRPRKASINAVTMTTRSSFSSSNSLTKMTIELEVDYKKDKGKQRGRGCGLWRGKKEKILKCNLDFEGERASTCLPKQKGLRMRKEFPNKSHLKLHFHNSHLREISISP
jgi:hypothetical protein